MDSRYRRKLQEGEAVSKAIQNSKEWQMRSDEAAEKRRQFAMRSDAWLVAKQSAFQKRHDAEQERLKEIREAQSSSKSNTLRSVMEQNRKNAEDAQEAVRAHLAEVDEMSGDNATRKIQEFEECKNRSAEHTDLCVEKQKHREQLQEDFQNKAKMEVKAKGVRSDGALKSVRSGAFQRQRSKRQLARSLAPSPTSMKSADQNDMTPRSGDDSQPMSPAHDAHPGLESPTAAATAAAPVPAPAEALTALGGSGAAPGSRSSQRRPSAQNRPIPPAMSASPTGGGQRRSIRGSEADLGDRSVDRRPSAISCNSADEAEFLEELETRSHKWLQDMREKDDDPEYL